jgi:hypothetical protein
MTFFSQQKKRNAFLDFRDDNKKLLKLFNAFDLPQSNKRVRCKLTFSGKISQATCTNIKDHTNCAKL